jgi:hypothetical protein
MRLCQKCIDAVMEANTGLKMVDVATMALRGVENGYGVPESECEFWVHKEYNQLVASLTRQAEIPD